MDEKFNAKEYVRDLFSDVKIREYDGDRSTSFNLALIAGLIIGISLSIQHRHSKLKKQLDNLEIKLKKELRRK